MRAIYPNSNQIEGKFSPEKKKNIRVKRDKQDQDQDVHLCKEKDTQQCTKFIFMLL